MKRNISTVALISCLLITTCLAGCLEDDDDDKTKPDFYGEVYWAPNGFGYTFEEDGIKYTLQKIDGSCDDYEGSELGDVIDSSGDYCIIELDFLEHSSEDEGDYYEICVTVDSDSDNECIEVYPLSDGMVMKEGDDCSIFVSDISSPSFDDDQADDDWMDEWMNVAEDIYDDDDAPNCEYDTFLAEDNQSGGLVMYLFDGRDAAGTLTDGMGEDLVHIRMTDGEPLSWAVLGIRIVANGGPSMTCDELDKADNYSSCTYDFDRSDNNWDIAEEITIAEGNETDLCEVGQGCDITVTIIKIGVGGDDDKLLAEIDVIAD